MNSNVKYLDSIFTRLFLRFDTAHDFANSKTDNPITRDFINDAIGDNLEKTYPILSGDKIDSHFEDRALDILKSYNGLTNLFLEDDAMFMTRSLTLQLDSLYCELRKKDKDETRIAQLYGIINMILEDDDVTFTVDKNKLNTNNEPNVNELIRSFILDFYKDANKYILYDGSKFSLSALKLDRIIEESSKYDMMPMMSTLDACHKTNRTQSNNIKNQNQLIFIEDVHQHIFFPDTSYLYIKLDNYTVDDTDENTFIKIPILLEDHNVYCFLINLGKSEQNCNGGILIVNYNSDNNKSVYIGNMEDSDSRKRLSISYLSNILFYNKNKELHKNNYNKYVLPFLDIIKFLELDEDMLSLLIFDIKRCGDYSQIYSSYVNNFILFTNDKLSYYYARLIGCNVLYTSLTNKNKSVMVKMSKKKMINYDLSKLVYDKMRQIELKTASILFIQNVGINIYLKNINDDELLKDFLYRLSINFDNQVRKNIESITNYIRKVKKTYNVDDYIDAYYQYNKEFIFIDNLTILDIVYNLPIITIDKYINSIQFYPLQKLLKKFVLNYRSDLENQNNINNAIASLLEIIEYIDKIVTGSLLISSNNREIYDMIYSKKNVESSVYTKDDLHKLLKTVWINSNIQSGGLIESTFKITKMRDEYFGYYTDTLKSVKIYRYFISRFFWIDCSADIELVMKSKLEIDINNDIMYKNFGETISKYNIGKLMADNLENLLSYYIQNFNKKMKQYELYVHLVSYLRDIGVFYDISETIVNPILDSILEKKCNYWLELYPDHPSSYDYIEVEEVDLSNYAKKVNKYIKYYYILTNFFDVSKYSDYFNELSDTMEYEELVDRLRNIVFDKILKDLLERNEFNKVFDSIRNVGYESHQIEKLYEISDYFNSVFYVRKNKERIPVETQTITFYNIEYDGVLSYKPIDYKIFLQYIDSNKTKS